MSKTHIFINNPLLAKEMPRLNIPKEKIFIGPALLWKRIAAFFIDLFIITSILSFSFRGLLKNVLPKDYSFSNMLQIAGSSTAFDSYFASIYIAMSILAFVYFYKMENKMSQTIGKKIMNIYVVSDAEQMKKWQLLVRNLFFIPIFPLDLLFIVDPLFMLFTKSNQRLTEILGKTRVVEKYSLDQN